MHVHNCAYGPRQKRHNVVRDAWLGLLRAAHWHADIEQVVRTGEDAFHRAALDGTLWAFDVSITATPGPEDTVHAQLERSTNAKASRYRAGGARQLLDGHTLVPLIHSADMGWLNLEALNFPQRILSQISAADAPPDVDGWQPHQVAVTQHHHARLSHALHLAHCQMHNACGRLL